MRFTQTNWPFNVKSSYNAFSLMFRTGASFWAAIRGISRYSVSFFPGLALLFISSGLTYRECTMMLTASSSPFRSTIRPRGVCRLILSVTCTVARFPSSVPLTIWIHNNLTATAKNMSRISPPNSSRRFRLSFNVNLIFFIRTASCSGLRRPLSAGCPPWGEGRPQCVLPWFHGRFRYGKPK